MAHLPSLQTLRALEAAERLRSYSKAAGELGLTHGAISHRMRELEGLMGVALFRREGNAMAPTEAGAELAAQVRQGLSLLEQAFARTHKPSATSKQVVISVVPFLAGSWLVERLPLFRAAHPDVELSVRVTETRVDFNDDGVDIGVRLGAGGWEALECARMFDEALTPVCAPDYVGRVKLEKPEDLQRATLLRNVWTPWASWFKAAGLDWREPKDGPLFDDSRVLLRAAVQGQGVALARHWLAVDDVRAGRLVTPFKLSVRDPWAYWIVWPARRKLSPSAAAFRDWLIGEAEAETPPDCFA
jgi:LysR family glycine cleavage system transcriptional activator